MSNNIILNEDVMFLIFKKIKTPTTYMNCLYVCSKVYHMLMKTHEDMIESFNFGIIGLYSRYPNLPWVTTSFQCNRSLTLRNFEQYPEMFKYNLYKINYFKNGLTGKIYDKYLNIEYKQHQPLSVINEIIKDNLNVPLIILFRHIEFIDNDNITFEDRISIPENHVDNLLNNMTILELAKQPDFIHIRFCVSSNKNVTMKIVLENLNFPWDYDTLTVSSGITIDDIINHPEFEWEEEDILLNTNITVKDFFKYRYILPNTDEIYDIFFSTAKLQMSDFIAYPEILSLCPFEYFCKNSSLTLENLRSLGKINYKYLSRNKSVTMRDVLDNINEQWDWDFLSRNLCK